MWKVDLIAQYKFRWFGVLANVKGHHQGAWSWQQGLAFVSREMLAVYQVEENPDVPEVGSRDASGGTGRYFLQILFLAANDGKQLGAMYLTTPGTGSSRLYPTHDGRFLIRTGELLRLYSADFQKLAEQSLPHSLTATSQGSDVAVSPSGRTVYIDYTASYPTQPLVRGHALLDADSLETIANPTPADLALWPGGPAIRFFPNAMSPIGLPGWFTLLGEWQTVDLWLKDPFCYSGFHRITPEVYGVAACNRLRLFAPNGHLLWDVPYTDNVASLRGGQDFIAVESYHIPADPFDLGLPATPLGIKVYNWKKKSEVCMIQASLERPHEHWPSIFHDVSPRDAVAVIEGSELSFYRP